MHSDFFFSLLVPVFSHHSVHILPENSLQYEIWETMHNGKKKYVMSPLELIGFRQ